MIIAASRGIGRIAHLPSFLAEDGRAVAGWGRKASGARALGMARRRGVTCLLLEDGFLRSVRRNDPPISLIVDPIGVYYDATAPSLVEQLISRPLTAEQTDRARALIDLWRSEGVSKYNDAPEYAGNLPAGYVLVVDQTFGDASIRYGGATAETFGRLLEAASVENPGCTLLVKVHPDVLTRRKRAHFDIPALAAMPQVRIVADNCHAAALIERASAVYTVTSQMGFEALMWGKRVRCFGLPFYAGWGLTEDEQPAPDRRGSATIEQLVHAALVAVPRYVDPATGQRWTAEQAVRYIGRERRALTARPPARSSRSAWRRILTWLARKVAR